MAETREIFFNAEEAVLIPTECPKCATEGDQRMCVMEIPGFKEIMMMAFRCFECGFENNELKPTAPSEIGSKFTLVVNSPLDLTRDMFQALSGTIEIEKIGLEFTGGPNAAKFTTVGDIISGVIADLTSQMGQVENLPDFVKVAATLMTEESMPYTFTLADPCGNSYIGQLDDHDNKNLTVEDLERTEEERARWG